MKDTRLFLSHDGLVTVAAVRQFKTSCRVNVRKFPFDKQSCVMQLSTAVRKVYMYVNNSGNGISDMMNIYENNSEWKDVEVERKVVELMPDKPHIEVTIHMERNPIFYVIYLLIPSLLMGFVSVLVFLLPPQSGERVGLSMTVLLSFTVFLLMVSDISPRGGENTSLLG